MQNSDKLNYTRGKWFVMDEYILTDGGKGGAFNVAKIENGHTSMVDIESNARIIAASPVMLEALRTILETAVVGCNPSVSSHKELLRDIAGMARQALMAV